MEGRGASVVAGSTRDLAFPGRLPGHLFLHGFTATPDELRFLADAAHADGFAARAPLLPGHGTSLPDLAAVRWQDWYETAEAAAVSLGAERAPVVVVGQSLGALLALHLAAARASWVSALVLLAPALFLRARWVEWAAPLWPLLARLRPYWPKGDADIADPQARVARIGYEQIALAALSELLRLQRIVRAEVGRVMQPALIVQSRQDHTCSWRGVEFLQARLGGPTTVLRLERSFHVVSLDYERAAVARAIRDFVLRGQATEG